MGEILKPSLNRQESEHGDEDGGDGVRSLPAEPVDEKRRHDHAHRPHRIRQNVQKCTLHYSHIRRLKNAHDF